MRRGSAWPEPKIGGHARSPASTAGARSTSRMAEEQRNRDVINQLVELWNGGDYERILSLYRDDIVMTAAPEWPDPGPWEGKEQVAWNQRQWLDAWDSIELVIDRLEMRGDKVLAMGKWQSRGRSSGLGGEMPVVMVLTLEDGLVTRFDWFLDSDEARRAADLPA
jgi:ketosteroid isomerase-like protein